jgi:hypothetical protein
MEAEDIHKEMLPIWAHTHIDTYSHTPNNANGEANKWRSGNALSTKDDP